MSYVIILVVLAAVLGPLMAVLPTKRQRHLAEQREKAGRAGLAVRLRRLPDIPPRFRFEAPDGVMCYERVYAARSRPNWQTGLFVRTPEGWQSLNSGREVPDALAGLPQGVVVVSLGPGELQVFWDESDGDDAVDRITATMAELQSAA